MKLRIPWILILAHWFFISGCFWQRHEDTLCRHALRTVEVDKTNLTGDQVYAQAEQQMIGACGSSDFKLESQTESGSNAVIEFRCMNVCQTEEEVQQPPGGNQ